MPTRVCWFPEPRGRAMGAGAWRRLSMSLRPCCSIRVLNSSGSTAARCRTAPVRALSRRCPDA